MDTDPSKQSGYKFTFGGSGFSNHAIPSWSAWTSLLGVAASISVFSLHSAGEITRAATAELLALSLSVALISSAAGNLLALALREALSDNPSKYWRRISNKTAILYLASSTVLLGIGTALSSGRATLGIEATIGTGLSFLYICQITTICTMKRIAERIALGFLLAATYSVASLQQGFTSASIADVGIHLAIFGITGLVMSLLSSSIHDEMRKKSEHAENMAAEAKLWIDIARKAHQIAEIEDPSEIQRVVVDATVTLGYEVSAISILQKERGLLKYVHPSPAMPGDLVERDLPINGISRLVLSNRNTQIIDYQSYPYAVPSIHALGLRTTIGVPMWNGGDIVAVLIAGSLKERNILAEELTALELLAAVASATLESRYLTSSLLAQIARYNTVIENSPNPTIVLDQSERVVLANKRVDLLFGYERQDLIGMSISSIVENPKPLQDLLNGPQPAKPHSDHFQTVALRSDGSRVDVELTAAREQSSSDQRLLTVNFQDITQQKELFAQLLDRANHDPVTGLANRIYLLEELRKSVVRYNRTKSPLALILFELDSYKNIRPERGTPDREKTMVSILHNLEGHIRETDLIARIGEDRFAVLAEETSVARTLSYARQLLSLATTPVDVEGKETTANATFGVSFAKPGISAEALLQRANSALLKGLTSNNSKIIFSDQGLKTSAQTRLQLEDDLSRALREQQFALEFQPIIDFRSRQIVSAEALIRWNHPERGWIPPHSFIPVAEETGVIVPIGKWVIRKALGQLGKWRTEGVIDDSFTLHLNVSRVQLSSDQIIRDVAIALEDFRIPSSQISIEVTESTFLADSTTANQIVTKLSELGILIAIDDFGTGYSSLSMLTSLPVNIVKIDKSFVDQLGTRSECTVEAIINMANRLGLTLVAEGIESKNQADTLLEMGCNYGQGFLFGQPASSSDFPKLIRKHNTRQVF